MFCPSCGIEYSVELNYCNRCGANLNTALGEPTQLLIPLSPTKPAIVIGTIMTVLTLGGFGCLVGGAIGLAQNHVTGDPLGMMVVFGMITILVTDILLARQLSRLITASLSAGKLQAPKRSAAPALNSASISQFPSPMTARLESAPSVTEHTTHFLEPAYREPRELQHRNTAEHLKG
jgi:hypothetical protein